MRRQLVGYDVAAWIDVDARLVEAEIVGVGNAADGDEEVAAFDLGGAAPDPRCRATMASPRFESRVHFVLQVNDDTLRPREYP